MAKNSQGFNEHTNNNMEAAAAAADVAPSSLFGQYYFGYKN